MTETQVEHTKLAVRRINKKNVFSPSNKQHPRFVNYKSRFFMRFDCYLLYQNWTGHEKLGSTSKVPIRRFSRESCHQLKIRKNFQTQAKLAMLHKICPKGRNAMINHFPIISNNAEQIITSNGAKRRACNCGAKGPRFEFMTLPPLGSKSTSLCQLLMDFKKSRLL